MNPNETVNYISSVIGNPSLAESICVSLNNALKNPQIFLEYKSTVQNVFNRILDNSIRDIETHERGKLFKRLIEFGGLLPEDTSVEQYLSNTVLSDEECISAVNFIYSHIINRFKGDLAEILAVEPCFSLFKALQNQGKLSPHAQLCFGDYIKEYQKTGNLAKGADGLIILHDSKTNSIDVNAVIEIKSMPLPISKLNSQIQKHISRLRKGLMLNNNLYPSKSVHVNSKNILRIMVVPSSWQINRKFEWIEENGKRKIKFPDPDKPLHESKIEEVEKNTYKITLNWSKESLEQAAYEMTFNYMSEVGISVYKNKPLPKGWEDMTPEQAGYNSIKEKLYYMMNPYHYVDENDKPIPLTRKQQYIKTKMIKLYNVYCFGYSLGIDSKQMLWPEDIKLG